MRWVVLPILFLPIAAMADVRVIDGDTFVLDGQTIRINGIDAPEEGQTCRRANGRTWACGVEATGALKALVHGKAVRCRHLEFDAYGRSIADCTAGGTNIAEAMVRAGLAWAYVKFTGLYEEAEAHARQAGLGIWDGDNQPAWDFRADAWTATAQVAPEGCPIKGNISKNGRIYHAPWSRHYKRTRINLAKGERWFCTEAEAIAAGWRAPYR